MNPIYTLTVGYSADGRSLHPNAADPEEGFRFPDLAAAKQEGSRLANRELSWVRNDAIATWVAIVSDGRVAEISKGWAAAISFNLGLID